MPSSEESALSEPLHHISIVGLLALLKAWFGTWKIQSPKKGTSDHGNHAANDPSTDAVFSIVRFILEGISKQITHFHTFPTMRQPFTNHPCIHQLRQVPAQPSIKQCPESSVKILL